MLQRQTQTAAFWRDHFEVTTEDVDFLHTLLLDAQSPRRLSELAIALIREYLRRENARIDLELGKGVVYLPKETFKAGQTLVFPSLDFTVGQVINVRTGQNPEHGDFDVITVRFIEGGKEREYAARLQTPHRLNQMVNNGVLADRELFSPEEIYKLYGTEIDQSLLYAMEDGERAKEFVQVEGNWLLSDMLASVHVGHLNIAEALIEMQSQPISTEQLLKEIDLDKNVPATMQALSLDHAMVSDARFDRVNSGGQPMWYLRRLAPAEITTIPALLRYAPQRYNRALLSVELLQFEWELDDEWGESGLSSEVPSIVPSTSLTLMYPHRCNGTLPLNGRSRSFFPTGTSGYSLVTLVDGQWGGRFTGWVSHQGRYVAGLSKWMDDHAIPVGAVITLERGRNGEVTVDFRARRPRREWARFALADLENNRIRFEMNKVQVGCEYDEHLIVAETDRAVIDELRQQMEKNNISLAAIIEQVMVELQRFNPQGGTVHAKSIYSAVNMVRRSTPGLVFYTMINNRRIRDMGNGEFILV